ncbi:DUF2066 domain-containing protein [Vibrio breoganii]|uniref:DUF2066 domain-containing protein n=1 Tax=Vibrio breoganii TaxID=553239 RepID=UPI0003607142|nr:DUF2066 domain-containing protein [Vibrio breoganii]OED98044.1 hypothetical protein A1QG_10855 [Vibrio breoganii ZF-29]OEF88049.1 hypothetical protein B003_14080 [Vibrio breoganii 1C10]PMG93696.1 hypothetical protein BCU80_07815 [Vibrio breoganii]PMH00292.1 hypothetical protein BCU79_03365 [Vibrio breoganii]PMJ45966.1 hypothetical protein BCU21_12075 [Vibrio breoganii]
MRFLACMLAALTSFSAFAVTKVNVFDTEAVVIKQKEDARYSGEELARREGMRDVIVRATGDAASLDNAVVKKAITQSSRFLSTITPSEKGGQPTLKMSFNPKQIQALLAQADLPYWPDERARLLVWVVEDNGYDRTISWEQSQRTSIENLRYVAAQKGLPITVPVGDIDDVTSIQPTEVWGNFTKQISDSSRRYDVDAVVVARITRNGSQQNLRWTLYDDKPQFIADASLSPVTGEASGTNKQVTETFVADLGRYYAQKSSAKASGEIASSVVVNFKGVAEAQSFFNIERMLEDLSSVASVELMHVMGSSVDFRVNLITDTADFDRQILRSNKVTKVEAAVEPVTEAQAESTLDAPQSGAESTTVDNTESQAAEEVKPTTEESVEPKPEVLMYEWQS